MLVHYFKLSFRARAIKDEWFRSIDIVRVIISGVARGVHARGLIHLHPIHAPVHPSYACVVLLFTYSLSQYTCFTILSQPVM